MLMMCTCFHCFLTAEAFFLCADFYLGNREMSQSVPKQKKKAPQYKGQKKSKSQICSWALLAYLLLFLFLFVSPAALLVKTLAHSFVVWRASFECTTCSLQPFQTRRSGFGFTGSDRRSRCRIGAVGLNKSVSFGSLQLPIMPRL